MNFFGKPRPAPQPKGNAVRQAVAAQVAARLDANPAVTRAPIDGAQVYYHPEFLDAATCAMLVATIDRHRRPSTLLSDRNDQGFRTSDSCDMDRWSPDIRPIDERIAGLLGIDPDYGETMQGQRYAPGQQFRAHHDYFHESESYWQRMQQEGGQRTWTAMIYLNTPDAGGATRFKAIDKIVHPEAGKLLAWNNLRTDGRVNPSTLHHGMKVRAGTKYVITKWFRERLWPR